MLFGKASKTNSLKVNDFYCMNKSDNNTSGADLESVHIITQLSQHEY